jgi:type III restriction enzyme
VNNLGQFGRWTFLEITDPWDAENAIRAFLTQHGVAGLEAVEAAR